jgi:hypothetical protein
MHVKLVLLILIFFISSCKNHEEETIERLKKLELENQRLKSDIEFLKSTTDKKDNVITPPSSEEVSLIKQETYEEMLGSEKYILNYYSNNKIKIIFKSDKETSSELVDFVNGEIIVKPSKSNLVSRDEFYKIDGVYFKVFNPDSKEYYIYNKVK